MLCKPFFVCNHWKKIVIFFNEFCVGFVNSFGVSYQITFWSFSNIHFLFHVKRYEKWLATKNICPTILNPTLHYSRLRRRWCSRLHYLQITIRCSGDIIYFQILSLLTCAIYLWPLQFYFTGHFCLFVCNSNSLFSELASWRLKWWDESDSTYKLVAIMGHMGPLS